MKTCARSILAGVGLAVLLTGAVPATASGVPEISILPAKHASVTVTGADLDGGVLKVQGEIARHRFGPRGPVFGVIEIRVLAADGSLVSTRTVAPEPSPLPKGVRRSAFEASLPVDPARAAKILVRWSA